MGNNQLCNSLVCLIIMFSTALLLCLVATVSCLPPPTPSPRSALPSGVDAPRHEPRVDHRLDLLGLSSRLSAAVAPLLDVFLAPIIESLPEEYLEKLADSIKKETLASLDPDQLTRDVRYFEDGDKLQLHEDYKNNVIIKTE